MPPRPSPRLLRRVGIGVALVLATVAIVKSGGAVLAHVDELSWSAVLLALVAVLGGLLASLMAWRALLADLGSPLPFAPASRVFFLGQLGKYVPGSVWPVVAQMEMGKEHGIPKARSGVVGLLTVAIALVAGLLVAALTLPFTSAEAASTYWYVFLAVPLLGGLLLPPVFNPLIDRALRLARRGGLERPLTARGLGVALIWSLVSWAGFGTQMWLIVRTLGQDGRANVLPLAVGAFALAWTAGFLVIFVPSGFGVREVVLIVALSQVLTKDQATLAALVSRALMTLGDGVVAGVAIAFARRRVPDREALAS